MTILRMTATFGCLSGETLELQDGLNILEAPNERGKSTWSAFLLSMLYGVDTGERNSKNNLAVKTKYQPWNGSPMAGRVDLRWEDREITITRSTRGRVPLGEFSAYETESGLPVEELTAENCGRVLLGVERSVFQRSAFLEQNALAVDKDADLERRLMALTATGEETVSFSETAQRLRDWKNRCRHNKTGLLPQAEAELHQVEDTIAEIHRLNQESMGLRAEEQRLTEQEESLTRQLQACILEEQLQKTAAAMETGRQLEAALATETAHREQLEQAQSEAEARLRCVAAEKQNARLAAVRQAEARQQEAQETLSRLELRTAGLPEAAVLDRLLQQAMKTDAEAAALPPKEERETPPPRIPAALEGCADVRRQAAEDAAKLDALQAKKKKTPLWWVACALLAAAILGFALLPPLGIAAAVCALTAAVLAVVSTRRETAAEAVRLQEAEALLRRYDAASRDEILTRGAEAAAAVTAWEQERQRDAAERAALAARYEAWEQRAASLRAEVEAFAGPLPGRLDGYLRGARQLVQDCAAARETEAQRREALRQLQKAVGDAKMQPLPETWVPGAVSEEEAKAALSAAAEALQQCTAALNRLSGRKAALEPLSALTEKKEQLERAMAEQAVGVLPARAEAEAALEEIRRKRTAVTAKNHTQRGLVSGKGDPAALEARREQLTARIAVLTEEEIALVRAAAALEQANAQMQSRFAPQLSQLAAGYLSRLTMGRYDRLLLDRELSFRAREAGALQEHPMGYLSGGTTDQVYLSVRLALCSLLLPGRVPLLLDDALVNFDDKRAAAALELLRQEAERRQILLFSCQSRENRLMRESKNGS